MKTGPKFFTEHRGNQQTSQEILPNNQSDLNTKGKHMYMLNQIKNHFYILNKCLIQKCHIFLILMYV